MLRILKAGSTPQPARKMSFLRTTVVDISTSYLPVSDMALLLDPTAPNSIAILSGDCGALFFVPTVPLVETFSLAAKEAGFSDRFISIMSEAAVQEIEYVRFDVEGGPIQGLNTLQKEQLFSLSQFRPMEVETILGPAPEPEMEQEAVAV